MTAALPHLNAILNAISTVLILTGFVLIRAGRYAAHRKVMAAALAVSAVFLVSYLIYHFTAPVFVFQGPAWIRPPYYALLISHVVLATAMPVLVLMAAWRAHRAWTLAGGYGPLAFDRHRAIARWALPVWLYVTVTGVLIYAMLYLVFPAQPVLNGR